MQHVSIKGVIAVILMLVFGFVFAISANVYLSVFGLFTFLAGIATVVKFAVS